MRLELVCNSSDSSTKIHSSTFFSEVRQVGVSSQTPDARTQAASSRISQNPIWYEITSAPIASSASDATIHNTIKHIQLHKNPTEKEMMLLFQSPVPENATYSNEPTSRSTSASPRRTKSKSEFPVKLYAMLELADNIPEFAQAITWLPHGRAFRVLDKAKFMKEVIPVFFNQTKISILILAITCSSRPSKQKHVAVFASPLLEVQEEKWVKL